MSAPRPRVWPSLLVTLGSVPLHLMAGLTALVALGLAQGLELERIEEWAEELPATPSGLVLLALPSQILFLGLGLGVALLSREPWRERLRLAPPRSWPAALALSLVATPALTLAITALSEILVDEPSAHLERLSRALLAPSGAAALLLVLYLSVLPGVCEELFFRGMLQSRLARAWGAVPGVLFAGACFALVHFDPQHVAFVFPLGLWFGVVLQLTRSLLAAMLAHAANNAFAITLTRALSTPGEIELGLSPFWIALVLVPLALSLFCTRSRG